MCVYILECFYSSRFLYIFLERSLVLFTLLYYTSSALPSAPSLTIPIPYSLLALYGVQSHVSPLEAPPHGPLVMCMDITNEAHP